MSITKYLPFLNSARTRKVSMGILGLACGWLVSCGPPEYGDIPFLCGTKGECPQDYQCLDKVCVRNGYQPSQAANSNPSSPTGSGNAGETAGTGTTSSTYVDTSGFAGQPPGAVPPVPPSFGNQGAGGFGGDQGGPWGNPCFFPADCPANQRCGFFTGRCCDPLANPSCI